MRELQVLLLAQQQQHLQQHGVCALAAFLPSPCVAARCVLLYCQQRRRSKVSSSTAAAQQQQQQSSNDGN